MDLRAELADSADVAVSRATTWRRLVDPHFLAKSVPGIQSIDIVAPERFRIVAALGFGLIELQVTVDAELFDLAEPERARLRASANAAGSNAGVICTVRLEDAGKGHTRLDWNATGEIGGMLAGFGAEPFERTTRKLIADFWTDFARRVEAAGERQDDPAPPLPS